jgi:hypothetical protein
MIVLLRRSTQYLDTAIYIMGGKRMSKRSVQSRRKRSAKLRKTLRKSLKNLRQSGGNIYGALADKFPQPETPGYSWLTAPNICQVPGAADVVFGQPFQSGGRARKSGGMVMNEAYYGRQPINYYGPAPTPSSRQ